MKWMIMIYFLLVVAGCKRKTATTTTQNGIFYTCSMHPQVMQDKPGVCPICHMDLIPVETKTGAAADAIMLSDQQMQLGNIQVDTVENGMIGRETILTATLNVDETKTTTVSARISGRIDRLYFKNEGDFIPRGARLYDLYSEELNNAKQEYLLAVEKQKQLDNSIVDLKQLVESARTKLLLWGMTASQIDELSSSKKTGDHTPFFSPAGGYITLLQAREGDYVMEGGTIVRLSNFSTLLAEAQVYTSQLSTFDPGGNAVVQIPDLGKNIQGRIQFLNPEINPETRINLIRIVIPNVDNLLRPGMPAYVILRNRERKGLTLPIDAVIRSEKMSTVWVMTGKNTFKSVMVETGTETNDRIEIRSGLKDGDVIVVRGAYLLQSEFIFKKGTNPMGGHDMSDM